jgi:hypothetical protein
MKESLPTDPDGYAAQLQDALQLHGPLSAEVRRLWRRARRECNVELERMFETKLAEFRRRRRQSRQPQWTNLPERAFEWVWDGVRYTPPREVLMTLVYVAFALIGVETLKQHVLPRFQPEVRHTAPFDDFPLPGTGIRAPAPAGNVSPRIEAWLVAELRQAAKSVELEEALAERMDVALEQMLSSPEFEQRLQARMTRALEQPPAAAAFAEKQAAALLPNDQDTERP